MLPPRWSKLFLYYIYSHIQNYFYLPEKIKETIWFSFDRGDGEGFL